MAGEFDFIDWIRSQQVRSDATPAISVGIGDDLAAVRWDAGDLLLVGVDQVLDGVHFDAAVHAPRDIGRKAMNRNLSDCAAMACLPAFAVAAVALPSTNDLDYAKELFAGLSAAAAVFDCHVIGGDTGVWPGKLTLTVTILGRSAGVTPVTRGGARPGDRLYVTGPLGGSILGRHMTFEPRVTLARRLASSYRLSAMIDLSDGLSRDLGHLCRAAGVGAILDTVPIHADVSRLPAGERTAPGHALGHALDLAIDHAIGDGEDYELLFASPDDVPAVEAIRIGIVTADPGVRLLRNGHEEPIASRGWEHAIGRP